MTGSEIRAKLKRGECVFGTHIASLMNPSSAAIAAGMELDFAFFCTEHMPLDRTEVGIMCRYYAARGISPIVRVPSPDPISMAMMTDGGAEGIVVPYMETVEEVKEAVGAVKYRPIKGKLQRDFLSGKTKPTAKMVEFLNGFNKENYLIIGIESTPALENLEQMISVPGVDGVFLGPHDISTSLGIPNEYDNPLFVNTVEDAIRRCRKHSVGVGLHTVYLNLPKETLQRYMRAGMNWLINGADIVVMRDAMNAQLRTLRQIAGSTQVENSSSGKVQPVQSCIT